MLNQLSGCINSNEEREKLDNNVDCDSYSLYEVLYTCRCLYLTATVIKTASMKTGAAFTD